MKFEKYDPQRFPEIRDCKWHKVREAVDQDVKPCEVRFVVCDHGKKEGYCKRHLAIEMEDNVRMRAALLVQLADAMLQ